PAGSRRARPTVRELPADLLTPVAAFLRVRHRGPGFLLESVERGPQGGRYSFSGEGGRRADGGAPLVPGGRLGSRSSSRRQAASSRCAVPSRATETPTSTV